MIFVFNHLDWLMCLDETRVWRFECSEYPSRNKILSQHSTLTLSKQFLPSNNKIKNETETSVNSLACARYTDRVIASGFKKHKLSCIFCRDFILWPYCKSSCAIQKSANVALWKALVVTCNSICRCWRADTQYGREITNKRSFRDGKSSHLLYSVVNSFFYVDVWYSRI